MCSLCFFFNPCSPLCAANVCLGVNPQTGAWVAPQATLLNVILPLLVVTLFLSIAPQLVVGLCVPTFPTHVGILSGSLLCRYSWLLSVHTCKCPVVPRKHYLSVVLHCLWFLKSCCPPCYEMISETWEKIVWYVCLIWVWAICHSWFSVGCKFLC